MMDDLRARFDDQLRRHAPWPGVERTDRITRLVSETWRGVLWSRLDANLADAAIAAEVERFAHLGEWEWKLYSFDRPADLGERLARAGFAPEATEALLVANVADLATEVTLPDGVVVETVADDAGVAALVGVHDDVFGGHFAGIERELLDDIRAGRAAAVIARAADGRAISSGRIEFNGDTEFASLYGGSTRPEWRRKGLFRALVAHRAALAADRGFRYLQTDASDDSRPILERLGFVKLGTTTPFVHP